MVVRDSFSLKFSRKYHVTHYLTNQSPRFSIKSHFESDFLVVHGGLMSWFVVVRGGLWWFVVVRGSFSLNFSRKYHVTHYLTNQSKIQYQISF